ncbi:MAG: terminase family protein [Acholeplasmataceae bacterium]|nr:terminase family protein [Acholeplasmataceae bacterium]
MKKEREKYQEAIGDVKTIVKTRKIEKILGDASPILTLYGATGNGKSMLATYKALARIFSSDRNKAFYVLAGKDITTLEKRFIESKNSVLNWKPFRGKWRYSKQQTGGAKVTLFTKSGKKYWYLTPFGNTSTFERVLGSTINGTFIDEAPESDEFFLKEIVARTIRTKGSWLIATGNGGDPKHYFYSGIVDKSRVIEDEVSSEEMKEYGIMPTPREEMEHILKSSNDEETSRFRKKAIMYHLSLEDNPVYTDDQLSTFHNLYPKGSFMYYSRILGIRGFQQNNAFSAYVNNNSFLTMNDIKTNEYSMFYPNEMVFSVDSGGHVFSNSAFNGIMRDSTYIEGDFGTEVGGHTIFLTCGFDKDYRNIIVLDTYFPNDMEQVANVEKINRKIIEYSQLFPYAKREYLFCDPADSSMRATLINRIRNVRDIRAAVKRDSELALDETVIIALIQQYMMKGRFKILDNENNRKFLYPMLTTARQEENGKIFDNGSWEADVWDALKYVFMSMYRMLLDK